VSGVEEVEEVAVEEMVVFGGAGARAERGTP